MATDDRPDLPLLNPVLTLKKEALPKTAPGGGQGEKGVMHARLSQQRSTLAANIERIDRRLKQLPSHSGKLHLVARMFDDSLAPTWTPRGLFDASFGMRLVAPARGGYLIEASSANLTDLAEFIRGASSIEARTAISRVEEIDPFDAKAMFGKRTLDDIWNDAEETEGGRSFVIWFAPFRDTTARRSVVTAFEALEKQQAIIPTFPGIVLPAIGRDADGLATPIVASRDQTGLARASRRYLSEGVGRTVATIPNKGALSAIAASGGSFRIDPVRRIEVTAPGLGAEPTPPPTPPVGNFPVVAVVDGGMTASSYKPLEAWRVRPLVGALAADTAHGNRVTSLVVHGYAWNNNLQVPQFNCSFGTIQAVPKDGSNFPTNQERLIDYLRQIAERLGGTVPVWNMSFNAVAPEEDPDVISYLGDEIRKLGRKHGFLPIISIGNKRRGNPDTLCAPADCEAALTVGGRECDKDGLPGESCKSSLKGPGPEGMNKPDVSWFSQLRMLGGSVLVGSSYATTLVSSLAAHTFENLKNPTPDLVRALLINSTELETHDTGLGWGTPWHGTPPWTCESGSVTLAWRANLRPGYAYYWNDIPIPRELIKNGKLHGKGKLTAILNPIVSEVGGPNYFVTRLQVALQYQDRAGKTKNLLGTMREDKEKELEARAELAKWRPIRRHIRDFSTKDGLTFSGDVMRLHARVYARDLFQFDIASHHELPEQEVAFVLTLVAGDGDPGIYNTMSQRLGTFVESAVIEQNLEVQRSV